MKNWNRSRRRHHLQWLKKARAFDQAIGKSRQERIWDEKFIADSAMISAVRID
jgi:hypothetical protein